MDASRLQDRLYWGLNRAANILGHTTDAYRPTGASDPLKRPNRYLRLNAAFSRADGNFGQPVGFGVAIWRGYFDASYTRVGDYLVQNDDIWFVAAQQSLAPVLCVKANRVLTITRQITPTTGVPYASGSPDSTINVISRWPASVLGVSAADMSATKLPDDTAVPNWTGLLPAVHGQTLQTSDIITDELGTNSVIVDAELSDLGWRLNIRQVTT
jgi:hypothetical protein